MFIRLVLTDIGVVPSSGLVQRVPLGSFSCLYTGACVHAFLRGLPPSLGFSLWKGFKLGIQFSLDMQLGGPWTPVPDPLVMWCCENHSLPSRPLCCLIWSWVTIQRKSIFRLQLRVSSASIYPSSCLANSSLWCELSDAPRKMIFVFLRGPPPLISLYTNLFPYLFLSHLRERNVPSSRKQALTCVISLHTCLEW